MSSDNDYIELSVTIPLRLRRGFWSDLREWNWAELLDLHPTEDVIGPVTTFGIRRLTLDDLAEEAATGPGEDRISSATPTTKARTVATALQTLLPDFIDGLDDTNDVDHYAEQFILRVLAHTHANGLDT